MREPLPDEFWVLWTMRKMGRWVQERGYKILASMRTRARGE